MANTLYRIQFQQGDKRYTLYAREVSSSTIWGFVDIGGLDWPNQGGVLVDPAEERLREEFADTRRLHLPMHALIRIEEVDRRGQAAIHEAGGDNRVVTPFPLPSRPPR
ncbi:DUF1820 family protein [Luteimonas sp. e5]